MKLVSHLIFIPPILYNTLTKATPTSPQIFKISQKIVPGAFELLSLLSPQSEQLLSHGCWCSKLNPQQSITGFHLGGEAAIDHLDTICKSWLHARACTKKLSDVCGNWFGDADYRVLNTSLNSENLNCTFTGDVCVDTCCQIDTFYADSIIDHLSITGIPESSVDNSCPHQDMTSPRSAALSIDQALYLPDKIVESPRNYPNQNFQTNPAESLKTSDNSGDQLKLRTGASSAEKQATCRRDLSRITRSSSSFVHSMDLPGTRSSSDPATLSSKEPSTTLNTEGKIAEELTTLPKIPATTESDENSCEFQHMANRMFTTCETFDRNVFFMKIYHFLHFHVHRTHHRHDNNNYPCTNDNNHDHNNHNNSHYDNSNNDNHHNTGPTNRVLHRRQTRHCLSNRQFRLGGRRKFPNINGIRQKCHKIS